MAEVVVDQPLKEEQLAILRVLLNAEPMQRRKLLKHADKELVCTLCECIINLLAGNLKVSYKNKKKLKGYKGLLRKIGNNSGTWQKKRRLIQKGGKYLIPLLAPILTAFFAL